ncbi:20022_t:CDS:2, partial [Funneliformis geosporum]
MEEEYYPIIMALCWGFTNPFIKRGSIGLEKIKRDSWIEQTLEEFEFLLQNGRYNSYLNNMAELLNIFTGIANMLDIKSILYDTFVFQS